MKIIKKICKDVLILLAGVVVGILLPYKLNGKVDEVALFPFGEQLWQRIFDVINAALLLATLLTAIFKEQILAGIYHAKFEIDKNVEYREMVDNNEQGSKASSYEKIMHVQNVGNRPAINCRLVLDSVSCQCENDYHATEIVFKESEIFPQSVKPSNNQLKPQGTLAFSIFRILPKVVAQEGMSERPMSFQIGNNEIEIKQGKTVYTITFHIEAEDMQSAINKIVVHWNGRWQNRKMEMDKELKIEYIS